MTTNEYIKHVKENRWPPFQQRLWQRNYWERIIRNEEELEKIEHYIIRNTEDWESKYLNLSATNSNHL